MNTTVIVHQDREPFVRMESFTNREKLRLTLAKTHNSLLTQGYALIDTREKDDQRTLTYSHIDFEEEGQRKIYVGVVNE